jgi:hypothetical protein
VADVADPELAELRALRVSLHKARDTTRSG